MENIERYILENNKDEAIYTSTKFLITIIMCLIPFLIPIKGIGYLIVIINIIVSIFTGVYKKYLKQMVSVLLPIALLMFVFQLFIVRGDTLLFNLGPLTATQEGLDSAITFSSNISGIASSIMLFFDLSGTKNILNALQNSNLPKTALFVISSTMLFIPESSNKAKTIREAQESRGVEMEGSLWTRLKSFVPMLAPLALSTISSNEEKVLTLEARGFSSTIKPTRLFSTQKKKSDKMLEMVLWLLLIGLIIGRLFIWN